MAVTGNKIDLILGLKLNEFMNANNRAWAEFSKTKGKIEGKPIRIKGTGAKELLTQIGKIYAAYMLVTRLVPNLIKLSDIQEKAENRLVTALKNAGAATKENIDKQMAFASWIQEVTTVGDEQALMLQSMALNMQAPIERTQEATKNAIALAKAFNLDLNVAMRASVSALGDNYTMLTRYIPALRLAGSEAEKAAIYQKTVTDGWITATEELKTNAGEIEDFGNTIGDLKEDLGDFIKTALIPLIRIIEPVVGGFTELEKSSQSAILATTLFIAVGVKVPAMLAAVRTGIMALNASLGPAGWLILGISAAATAWGAYSLAAEDASKANEKFKKSTSNVKSFLDAMSDHLKDLGGKTEAQSLRILDKLYVRLAWAQRKGSKILIAGFEKQIEKVQKHIKHLKRIAGDTSIDPLTDIYTPEDVQMVKQNQGEITAGTQDFYLDLQEIRTGFYDLGNEQLEDEYSRRNQHLADYMANVEFTLGKESKLYRDLMILKWALDLNYNKQKMALEGRAVKEIAFLGAEMMATFQSQSQGLFEIGKALAVANLLITKGEAIARAFKDYPFPLDIAIAAIQGALVAGQIANVQSVKFQPKGKAAGGLITDHDLVDGAFLPQGEDGYIPVQSGEMVINRRATRQFMPILEEINNSGKKGFAEGGIVSSGDLGGSGDNSALLYAMIQDAIIQGFNKSNLRISGQFTARGRDLQAAIDKNTELKETL